MTQTTKPDIAGLAGTIIGATEELRPADQSVGLALLRELADGKPVAAEALARRAGTSTAEAVAALDRLPFVYRDEDGRVVGFWGLSLAETPHRLRVEGRDLHTWCAWDTLFVPELLGMEAEVESSSPVSGAAVRLRVARDGARDVVPEGALVSMLMPTEAFDRDAITSFCHFVHFFPSRADAEPWLDEHRQTFLLTVEEAFELGRLTNHARLGAALDASRS
jgi:alkylmercury lyase